MVRAGFHARAPFATNAERVAHRAETVAVVAQIMKRKIRDEWMSVLGDASIPCLPVHTLGELSALPAHRSLRHGVPLPRAASRRVEGRGAAAAVQR